MTNLPKLDDNWFFLEVVFLSSRNLDGIDAKDLLHICGMHRNLGSDGNDR